MAAPLGECGWGEKGAESGVRTRTPAKAADFKSAASACSAIPARDDDIVPGWGKRSVDKSGWAGVSAVWLSASE